MRNDLMRMREIMDKLSPAKKEGKLLTYEASYTKAVADKWKDKGGKDAYIKAAKAWNLKKYGTTEPTKVAKEVAGGDKEKLATANAELSKKPEKKELKVGNLDPKNLKKEQPKIKTKEDIAKEKIASGDKKAGKAAGLKGKDKRKANKDGKAQGKVDKVKDKIDATVKEAKERQKQGKNIDAAQAKIQRLKEKRKRKEKKVKS